MHRKTLYRHNEEGKRDTTTPIARITVDDNALVEIRMLDGSLIVSINLEHLGYLLLWQDYPAIRGYVPEPRVTAT